MTMGWGGVGCTPIYMYNLQYIGMCRGGGGGGGGGENIETDRLLTPLTNNLFLPTKITKSARLREENLQ